MPDPNGAKRLLARQCLVKFTKDTLIKPVKVKSFDDLEVKIRPDGTQRYKTKTRSEPIWLVEISMPRRYVDEFATDVVEVDDDSYVDTENLNAESELVAQDINMGDQL
jgi:hypothetical protein